MVSNERLAEAAIALQQVFHQHGIKNGLFGGFAIAALGGVRSSKDLDVIAALSKGQIVEVLSQYPQFRFMQNTREDYSCFVWSDREDMRDSVLVEVFPERFTGSTFALSNVPVRSARVAHSHGSGYVHVLDPVYLFKGKLRAAALREKFSDAFDLRWLEQNYNALLSANKQHYDLRLVGIALKRWSELKGTFERLGLDVETAGKAAKAFDLRSLPPDQSGDVQKGLLKLPTPMSSREGSTKSQSSSKKRLR